MQSVIKNALFMIFGSVGQKIISLAYFAFLVRILGKELTGEYTAALALSTLFVVFIDLGLTNMLIRNGARKKEALIQTVSNIFAIKTITAALAYGAMILFSFFNFSSSFTALVAVSGITMILDTVHLTLYGYLRAIGELKYEAWGMVMSQFITLAVGTVFLIFHFPLIFVMAAFTIASGVNVLYSRAVSAKKGMRLIKPDSAIKLRMLAGAAIPFALAVIFGRLYSYSDVIVLKIIKGSAEVGIYSTPSKISFAFQFIPLALSAALYPALSGIAESAPEKFREILTHGIRYLVFIAAPISAGIFILADPIMIFAFSREFSESVPSLKIMIASLVFSFVSFAVGAALNACGAEKKQTAITACAFVLNFGANLMLIPRFGAVGAAWSAFMGNVILGLAGFFFIPSRFTIKAGLLMRSLAGTVAATACMYVAVFFIQKSFGNLFVSIVAGGAVFVFFSFVFGAVSAGDFQNFKRIFGKSKILPTMETL